MTRARKGVILVITGWDNIQNKPDEYQPAEHTHEIADVDSLQDALDNLQTALTAAQTAIDEKADANHDHDGVYEPVFDKNAAFNKDFGTAGDSVCEGDDSRLSDNRTPVDSSVSYAKVGSDLKSKQAVSAADIDWSSGGLFTKTLTADTTFTFSNLQLNKTVTLIVSGDFVITWPSYVDADHLISGEYDGTANNYIQIHCTNATSGSEEVWWAIKTEGA